MQIVYCDTCGTRIGDDEDVAAANLSDGTIMCTKCRVAAGKPARISHAKINLGSSAKRLLPVKPPSAGPAAPAVTASGRPRRTDSPPQRGNPLMFLGGMAAVLAIGGAAFFA